MADDKKRQAAAAKLTPTQAEADEFKANLVGGTVEMREGVLQREVLAPTPTQAENDAFKLAAISAETPPPPAETPPPPTETPPEFVATQNRKQVEANPTSGGYQTRAAATTPAKED